MKTTQTQTATLAFRYTVPELHRKANAAHRKALKASLMTASSLLKGSLSKAVFYRNKAVRQRSWCNRYLSAVPFRRELDRAEQAGSEG